ncbi:uncharacterized protein LOC122384140 [Amphibalanus amphitrite]|uniref:uncharacterized protein LOC122384140 n=1 Tax=Amphibalanus amphitrite TaxID=1232801 RepID=UPI001C929089|nr:uncharacterized protein LOC122384140 [Amphibalanus amphitrite]
MASLKLLALGLLAVVAVTEALPRPQAATPEDVPVVEDVQRIRRQGVAENRDDPYGPPSYQPEPYKPEPYKPDPYKPSYHKGGPVYVKTFVKTDYDGNFKWGVKHNIEEGYH